MLNRNQSAASRQLLLALHLLSNRDARDERSLRESLPPYEKIYESSLRREDEEKARDTLRKRLAEDVEVLVAAGIRIEVEGDPDGRRYRLSPDGFSPVELDLTEDERAVLAGAVRSMSRSFPYSKPLHLALANLLGSLASGSTVLQGDKAPFAASLSAVHDAAISRRVGKLDNAISRRKRVRFAYHPEPNSEIPVREIEPYVLSLLDDSWYVTGRVTEEDRVRQFAVARIRGTVTFATRRDSRDFEMPESFERLFAGPQAPWQLGELVGRRAHIRLESHRAMSRLLRSYRWAGTFGRDGKYRIFITHYSDEHALAAWVLSLGTGATVLAPESLIARVTEALEKLTATHAEAST